MAHAMFRSDNMEGTTDGKFLVSLYISTDAGLDNGNVVKVGALKSGEREVRTYTTPALNDALGDIAILGSEEVLKDKKYNTVGEFYNAKGTIARGYKLVPGDLFAVTADALNAVPEYTFTPGTTIVELMAGNKLNAVNELSSGATKVGVLEAKEIDGAVTWLVFRVV